MPFGKYLFLIFIFSFLLIINCTAQTPLDDLARQWSAFRHDAAFATDTNSVILLNQLAEKSMENDTDTAIWFGNEAVKLAKKQNYQHGAMDAFFSLGKAYYIQGSYLLALESYMSGIRISRNLQDTRGYGKGLNGLGLIHIGQHNYKAALKELFKAVVVNEQVHDSLLLIKNYFNIGLCYDETEVYDSALFYLGKVLQIGETIDDNRMIVMAYNRLGETYFHMENHKAALEYYNKVLNETTFRSNWEYSFAYAGLGQTYYAMGDYQRAVDDCLKSYEFAKKMNAKWDMERAVKILSESYAAMGDFKQAYHYQLVYKMYSDTLFNEAKEKEINFLHLQQKEAENKQLARDNQIQQQQNFMNKLMIAIISLLALFLVIVAVMVYRNNRQKNKLNGLLVEKNINIAFQKEKISEQNASLQAINETKDQLFSVISHDLKSPFASIISTFELIRKGLLSPGEQQEIFNQLYNRVNTVFEMLNNLLYWSSSQQKGLKTIPRKITIFDIVDDILSVSRFIAQDKGIFISHRINLSEFIFADPDHVKIILQNIIGNAIKFTPHKGQIHLFYSEDANYFNIHIKDNGVGIPPEKLDKLFHEAGRKISSNGTNLEKGTGLGLMLVHQFVYGNNGKLKIKSQPKEGTEFIVFFPKYVNQHNTKLSDDSKKMYPNNLRSLY